MKAIHAKVSESGSLSVSLGIKVVTADRTWKALGGKLDVDVELIR